jgi:CDP-paratose 2-epimerase
MPHLLVTGGAGFIGSHTARRYLDQGWRVTVFDNLTRAGSSQALDWLRAHPNAGQLAVVEADVQDHAALAPLVAEADAVLHAAGQTAVTTSVASPREDFQDNALGTLNVLEAARESLRPDHNPPILYTSTNKVYGGMEEVGVELADDHYQYRDLPDGVSERQPLDFHSPYGCSKGAGDQYTRDYARIYGLRTVIFRQSCIYGDWQFGTEDQGWLAHFTIAALLDLPLTIYGDGRQVRDVLYVDDLVDAYQAAISRPDVAAGQIYNIGGGPARAISLLDLIAILEGLRGRPIAVSYDNWRPGDQRVYVSDVSKVSAALGWSPRVDVKAGVERLFNWAASHREMLEAVRATVAARAGR